MTEADRGYSKSWDEPYTPPLSLAGFDYRGTIADGYRAMIEEASNGK